MSAVGCAVRNDTGGHNDQVVPDGTFAVLERNDGVVVRISDGGPDAPNDLTDETGFNGTGRRRL